MRSEESVHCGEVGIVQSIAGAYYPDMGCGYFVKFDDGDKQVCLNTFTE